MATGYLHIRKNIIYQNYKFSDVNIKAKGAKVSKVPQNGSDDLQ